MPKDSAQEAPVPARGLSLLRATLRYGASAGLLLYLIALALEAVGLCRGELVYGLDDAYIHMALARRLVQEGIWGLGDGFASAVSSILWPLALALVYAIKGPDTLTPLILEFLGVLALMAYVHHVVHRDFPTLDRRHWPAGLAILAIALAAPINALVLGGLEHIWHIVALLVVADRTAIAVALEEDAAKQRRAERILVLVAPLLSLVRFESLALVPLIGLLLLLRRRWLTALATVIAALAPVLVLGLASLSQGGYFWPNSLMLKTVRYAPGSPIGIKLLAMTQRLLGLATEYPAFFALLLLAFFTFTLILVGTRKPFSRPAILLLCALAQALAHALFGAFGWLFRYEAYVMALGVFAILYTVAWLLEHPKESGLAVSLGTKLGWWRSSAWIGLIALAMPLPFLLTARAVLADNLAPMATRNIYEQQVQVARFLHQFYDQSNVALNDIGAISYFTDVRPFDLFGLGSNEVTRAKMEGRFQRGFIDAEASRRHLELAVVYDTWYDEYGGLPKSWIKVAEWEIYDNVVCGSPIVAFYATSRERAALLEKNLMEFTPSLPREVGWRFMEAHSTTR